MAWQTKKEKEQKKRSRFSKFRRAFLKATLGGALVFGSYQYYTPEPVKNAINETAQELLGVKPATADITAANLTFNFKGDNSPEILDSVGESIFITQGNIMDEWYASLGRHQLLLQKRENRVAFDTWLSQLDHLFGKSIEEKAKGVDALVDRQITYQLDNEHYNNVRSEYWASPLETIRDGRGDCEDFAILKYHALRYLNVPAENLFIIAVSAPEDTKLTHANLAVDIRESNMLSDAWDNIRNRVTFDDGAPAHNFVILDNDGSKNGLLAPEDPNKYKMYFAFNETGIWQVKDVRPVPEAKTPTSKAPAKLRAPGPNEPGV